jgi:hypothetical protein
MKKLVDINITNGFKYHCIWRDVLLILSTLQFVCQKNLFKNYFILLLIYAEKLQIRVWSLLKAFIIKDKFLFLFNWKFMK